MRKSQRSGCSGGWREWATNAALPSLPASLFAPRRLFPLSAQSYTLLL